MNENKLIKQVQIEVKLSKFTTLFENLKNNGKELDKNIIKFGDWIENYFRFIEEIRDNLTYLDVDIKHEMFINNLQLDYPYLYSQFFDPESLFSDEKLKKYNEALEYCNKIKLQKEELKVIAKDFEEDFYINKLEYLRPISSQLKKILIVKKMSSKDVFIFDNVINHLEHFYESNDNFISSMPRIEKKLSEETRLIKNEPENINNRIFTNGYASEFFMKIYEDSTNIKKNPSFFYSLFFQLIDNDINAIYKNTLKEAYCDFINKKFKEEKIILDPKNFKQRENSKLSTIIFSTLKEFKDFIPFSATENNAVLEKIYKKKIDKL